MLRDAWQIGRLFGIPLGSSSVVAAIMLFVSVIQHELGHSLVARRRGIGISSILHLAEVRATFQD